MPCPSQYADWIEELADEGITAGCGSGNFCPTQMLGSWQMLAWAQKVWPGYCPLPRTSVLTYRDEGARVITEANQLTSGDDTSETITYPRDNVFLGSQLVSSAVWTGTTPSYQFFAVDHLGSTRLATDMTGLIVESYKYWPYGDDGPGTGTANQRLTFAGMERDTENKHYFDHARTQDFNIGRFVSADRAWGGQGAPQSWNRYSYVMNNPTSLTDPWGFDASFSCQKDENDRDIPGTCTQTEDINVGGDSEPAEPVTPQPSTPIIYPIWPSTPSSLPGGSNSFGRSVMTLFSKSLASHSQNACVTGALVAGAVSIGIDSIGLIPEAGGLARAIGHQAGYAGVVADQLGTRVVKAVGASTGAFVIFGGLSDASPDGYVAIGLAVGGLFPGLGQGLAVVSMFHDAYVTAKAVGRCY